MVAVHKSFKANFTRKSVGAGVIGEHRETTAEVWRVSDKRLVTEEHLQVFVRDLKEMITTEVTERVTNVIVPELKEITSLLNYTGHGSRG